MNIPALFLDRDGVINVDHGYVYRNSDFKFVSGIFKLVERANKAGWPVIVVTNQAGIGRGYYTEAQFLELTAWMRAEFKKNGACIDAVYYCPFHPDFGIGEYKMASHFRKPSPGMLIKAAQDWSVDLSISIIVGDKQTDMEAGLAAGVQRRYLFGCDDNFCETKTITNFAEIKFD